MAHDVFVSYSSHDKPFADAVCARLEADGVRCWIAPRDILAGSDWGEAIIDGIEGSRLMLLVFSSNSNASAQVKREVERAVNKGLVIVPVRIEDVLPARSLEYFLSTPHWLDAMTPPFDQHLGFVSETVGIILARSGDRPTPIPVRPVSRPRPSVRAPSGPAGVLVLVALGVVAVGAVFGLRAVVSGGGSPGAGAAAAVNSGVDSKLVGRWRTTSTSDGLQLTWDVAIASKGTYSSSIVFDESGTFRTEGGSIYLKPTGQTSERSSFWQPTNGVVDNAGVEPFALITFDIQWAGASKRAVVPSNGQGRLTWTLARSDAGAETWTHFRDVGGVGISLNETLVLEKTGAYTLKMANEDSGTVTASNGSGKTVSTGAGILDVKYGFIDNDHIALDWAGGNRTWARVK